MTLVPVLAIPLLAALLFVGPVPAAPPAVRQTITFTHDANGRLTRAAYGDSVVITYDYDVSGNIVRRAVTRLRPAR